MELLVPFLKCLWYDAVFDWGLHPGPPALKASTLPLGYQEGVISLLMFSFFFKSAAFVCIYFKAFLLKGQQQTFFSFSLSQQFLTCFLKCRLILYTPFKVCVCKLTIWYTHHAKESVFLACNSCINIFLSGLFGFTFLVTYKYI